MPSGKGKVYFSDGSKVSGNFANKFLQGHGKIKIRDLRIDAEFVDGIPTQNARYLYQGIPGNFFIKFPFVRVFSNGLITKRAKVNLFDLVNVAFTKISTLKDFFILIPSLALVHSEDFFSNYGIVDDIENKIADIDINFKQCESWNEYETKLSRTFGIEKVVRNNDVYIGDSLKGKGKILFNNGEIYKGQVVNRIIHGFGKYLYKDGRSYLGEFVKGKKNGIGIMIYGDKHYYQGHWKDDEKFGRGIWKNANKRINCFNTMKGPAFEDFLGIFTEGSC